MKRYSNTELLRCLEVAREQLANGKLEETDRTLQNLIVEVELRINHVKRTPTALEVKWQTS